MPSHPSSRTRSLTTSSATADHLRVDGVSRSYADRRVLTDVSFVVPPHARVGLIGENGAGKSTLLRLVAGRELPDRGTVTAPGRVGLLWQELPFTSADPVRAVLDDAQSEADTAAAEVQRAGEAVAADEPGAGARLTAALAAAEDVDAWSSSAARRAEVVDGFGLGGVAGDVAVGRLSGGQRSRLALAALLLARPQALLLDEPTNHLDDEAVGFLAATLRRWSGPVLFASHDRAFLDEVATRLVDLDPSPLPAVLRDNDSDDPGSGYNVQASGGRYSDHLVQRAQSRERWRRRFAAEQTELGRLRDELATARAATPRSEPRTEARAARKFYADRTAKVTSRLVRTTAVRLAALEREQVTEPPAPLAFAGLTAPVGLASPDGPLLRAAAVEVEGRLAPVDLVLDPGRRLLVTGGNGAGKSTLLHVLHGGLSPSGGTLDRVEGLRTALLEQDVRGLDPAGTPRAVYASALGEERAERLPLAALGLLAERDLDRPLGRLSVGQQRRLALALVLADPPPLVLLDEPTNHLSLALADELEAALETFAGAVVLASHDRWLRRRWSGATLGLRPAG